MIFIIPLTVFFVVAYNLRELEGNAILVGFLAALVSIPITVLIFYRDKKSDNQSYPTSETEGQVNTLPTLYGRSPIDTPYYSTHITPPSPEAVIAQFRPDLAAGVLGEVSRNATISNLANSAMGVEFARQRRGIEAGARHRKGWFGTETTEFYVRPSD